MFLRLLCCAGIFASAVCWAAPLKTKPLPKICMILDKGGKDDHSFNESAIRGLERARKSLPISPDSKFVEPRNEPLIAQFLTNFATNANCDLIIGVGYLPSTYISEVAKKYKDKKFLALDINLDDKNVNHNISSVTFEEHEGSFLVGAIAAMKTKTNKIGFVGGMDVPLIHRFEMGFRAGIKHINPTIQVSSSYVGITPEAWNNPSKAKELALSLYNTGVDIIFQVAAASGQGVFNAAEELNKSEPSHKHYAIGVDSNQNWISPKIILTSMVKKIDVAVFDSIQALTENKFVAGHTVFGLQNEGVDWAYDSYNKSNYSADDLKRINEIKQDIVSGKIVVPDYYKIKTNR